MIRINSRPADSGLYIKVCMSVGVWEFYGGFDDLLRV